eukprot:scaffold764_cov363-Pavlova_lutheri.AAC.6
MHETNRAWKGKGTYQRRARGRRKRDPIQARGVAGSKDGSSQPTCTVIRAEEGYELRLYDPFVCVCTEYRTRGEGIDALAEYLDGKNDQGARYPSTQPLLMAHHVDRKVMKLFVASSKAVDVSTLPRSNRPGVRLDLEGGHLVAASAFLGHATKERVEQEHHQLTHKLQADGLALACHDAQEKYHVAQYGPLFSLQPRKNELWVRVQL